jgi:cytochrome P450
MTAALPRDFMQSDEYLLDPLPYWRRLREDEPLYRDPQDAFWMLSRYDDVVTVLKDDETYATLP